MAIQLYVATVKIETKPHQNNLYVLLRIVLSIHDVRSSNFVKRGIHFSCGISFVVFVLGKDACANYFLMQCKIFVLLL